MLKGTIQVPNGGAALARRCLVDGFEDSVHIALHILGDGQAQCTHVAMGRAPAALLGEDGPGLEGFGDQRLLHGAVGGKQGNVFAVLSYRSGTSSRMNCCAPGYPHRSSGRER